MTHNPNYHQAAVDADEIARQVPDLELAARYRALAVSYRARIRLPEDSGTDEDLRQQSGRDD